MGTEAKKCPVSASSLNLSMVDLEPQVLGSSGHGHLLNLGPTRVRCFCQAVREVATSLLKTMFCR